MELQLKPLPGNELGPQCIVRWLQSGAFQQPVSLLVRSSEGQVGLSVRCAAEDRGWVEDGLQDAYPGLNLEQVPEWGSESPCRWSAECWLTPDLYCMPTYESAIDQSTGKLADPLAALLTSVRLGSSGEVNCGMRLIVEPATERQIRRFRRIEQNTRRFAQKEIRQWYARWARDDRFLARLAPALLGQFSMSRVVVDEHPSPKTTERLYSCRLLLEYWGPETAADHARERLNRVMNGLAMFESAQTRFVASDVQRQSKRRGHGFLLTANEIATLWHPLTRSNENVARLLEAKFRELEPAV